MEAAGENEPIKKIMPAIVAIYGPPLGGICAGSVISHNLIVTAGHCVSGLRESVVIRQPESRPISASVVFLSHDFDLAILKLDVSVPQPYLKIVSISDVPKTGDQLTVIGHRWGEINDVENVRFEGLFRTFIKLKSNARPGNSGGPVLNEKGEIVGVLFGVSLNGYAFAVPSMELEKALSAIETSSHELKPWSPSYKNLGYRFSKNGDEVEHHISLGISYFYETYVVSNFGFDLGIHPQLTASIGFPLQPYFKIGTAPYFVGINMVPTVEGYFDPTDGKMGHRFGVGIDMFQIYFEILLADGYQSISIDLRSPL
jgi:hypothetical protein